MRIFLRYWLFPVLAAVLLGGACAPPSAVRKEEPPGESVQGVLEPKGIDVPLTGAKVTAGDRVATAGPGGAFTLGGLPRGKVNLVVEKRFDSGPVRRVMGVATLYVSDTPIRIVVPVRDATDVDRFCEECHPYKGQKTRRDQILRCLHVSGVWPKKANKSSEFLDPMGKVTCESCHTVHRETKARHFVVVDYQDGKLCNQCH
jgi:hypothetical protein